MKKIEITKLIQLLEKFEKETRLKEIGLFENATIMDTIRIIKRVNKNV